MSRSVNYNSQRDNFVINGIPGSSQCFATSAWMFLSYYAPEKFKYDDDAALKRYIAELTAVSTDNEYEWNCQRAILQKYMTLAGFHGNVMLGIDLDTGIGKCDIEGLKNKLSCGPVIIGTKKMAGLPGGHIILGIDNTDSGSVLVNDPYGNALTGYSDKNGASVVYPVSMFDAAYPQGPVRVMWYQN